jgi:hypothetical protein
MPIGFAAQRLEVEVGSLTGAAYGERTPEPPLGGVARLHDLETIAPSRSCIAHHLDMTTIQSV